MLRRLQLELSMIGARQGLQKRVWIRNCVNSCLLFLVSGMPVGFEECQISANNYQLRPIGSEQAVNEPCREGKSEVNIVLSCLFIKSVQP